MSLSACAAAFVRRAADQMDRSSHAKHLERSFFVWCVRYWQDNPLSQSNLTGSADGLVQRLAHQPREAGKAADIDPLFSCILFKLYFLD